jgi:hypothetical protein
VNLNYFDLEKLSKQEISAGENPGCFFGVLDTGRVNKEAQRVSIQLGEIYPLFDGLIITTSRQRIICAVLAWLRNFCLSSTMVPDGNISNEVPFDNLIRCQIV